MRKHCARNLRPHSIHRATGHDLVGRKESSDRLRRRRHGTSSVGSKLILRAISNLRAILAA